METRTIRVTLADDEALARSGVRALLAGAQDIEVVAEAQDGFEVQALAAEWQPQVIVLDLKMPGPFPNPAALLAWLHTHHPGSAVLPLTGHGREALLAQLMEAGAAGYLEKTASAEALLQSIRSAAAGVVHFEPEQMEQAQRWQAQVGSKWKSLSRREHEVALWLTRGATDRGMAGVLGISKRTVETHVANILKKLELETRAQVIAWVLRHFPEEVGGNW